MVMIAINKFRMKAKATTSPSLAKHPSYYISLAEIAVHLLPLVGCAPSPCVSSHRVMVVSGLDHSVTLVHEHCKQLLLNLLLAFSTHGDHFAVAKVLLGNQCMHDDTSLTLPSCGANKDYAFMGEQPHTHT